MKIVWVSPFGDGWAIAYRLREAGHKVVYVPLNGTRNGEGFLPRLDPAEHWQDYAKKADVTFVDATPASRRTRRSYEPSDLSLELARLRHFGVPLIGPTPTSELIQNDPRYFRKTMRRLGLLSDAGGVSSGTRAPHALGHLQRLFLSAGPFGQTALVVRARRESTIADAVFPIAADHRGTASLLGGLQGFLAEIGHSSYINAEFVPVGEDLHVIRLILEPLYPACFHLLGDLLGTGLLASYPETYQASYQEPPRSLGLAVVLNRLQEEPDGPRDIPLNISGFFGAELHAARQGQEPEIAEAHGLTLGALIGNDLRWSELTSKVQLEAERVSAQIGGCVPIFDGLNDIPALIQQFHPSLLDS